MHLALVYLGRENPELEYISAALKKAGHRISFAYDPGSFTVNDNILNLPRLAEKYSRTELIVKQLFNDPPEAVFFFVHQLSYDWSLNLAEKITKRLNVPIIFGGRHPTMAPHAVMEQPVVDFTVVGEAEESLFELLAAIAGKRTFSSVRGIYYREGDLPVSTGLRPPIKDLDSLPWPDKDLFAGEINPADDYVVMVGRGCPGSCTYCQEGILHRMFGGSYFRRRSIDSVLGELENMKRRHRFGKVMISDPIFFTPKKWTLELLEGYRRRIGTPFRCYGQMKWLDEEIARALKEANCYGVEFGFQIANDRIRREILNRPETNEDARRAFAICDHYHLNYDIDHIFGLPGETEQDFIDAAHIYADCRYLNRIKVHMLVYFPGAPILKIAKDMGLAGDEDEYRAQQGLAGDICRVGSVQRAETEAFVREWKNFYKLMPLLGRRLGHAFARRGWNRWFDKIPSLLVMLLQILVAFRGRDYRFWIYIKYYRFRLRRHREVMKKARAQGLL